MDTLGLRQKARRQHSRLGRVKVDVDTPAGLLTARPIYIDISEAATAATQRLVGGISLIGLPGFVQAGALPVAFGGRLGS